MNARWAADVLVVLGAAAHVGFIVGYSVLARWWAHQAGRLMVASAAVTAAALVLVGLADLLSASTLAALQTVLGVASAGTGIWWLCSLIARNKGGSDG